MTPRPPRVRSSLFALAGLLTLAAGTVAIAPAASAATTTLPCDIYSAAYTPCVAAHSTTRALYASYNGPLYQVTRASDGTSTDIGLLAPGGYANAAAQDTFCAGTSCTITVIYDQSPRHNDLPIAATDVGADASKLPITLGGHKVYGVRVVAGVGYRHNLASGTARDGRPEGMYMVASGTRTNFECCFDYGNAEATATDTGNGHMDAVTLTTNCFFHDAPCTGGGPWVQADMENGLFLGGNGSNPKNLGNATPFVTAMLKNNGQTTYALKGGNSRSGGLTTWYDGPLPTRPGYTPMHQEGSIILGIGGDNSKSGIGDFFEGVMTAGYPSDHADNAVQADIVSAGYSGLPGGVPPFGVIRGPGGKCVTVSGHGAAVNLSDCQSDAVDQYWRHNLNGTLTTLGRCLDTVGTKVEIRDCNGTGGQTWIQQPDGTLLNPQSGRCLDDPAHGTLRVRDCDGTAGQKFTVTGGAPITVPDGKCIDVSGEDTGTDGAPVQLWDCVSDAVDQYWEHNPNGTLTTLDRCLDIAGNGTAAGTKVQLWDCNGVGGQTWIQQPDGTLFNPQSGRCLDDPNGTTTNGTQLQIQDCDGTAAQKFTLR